MAAKPRILVLGGGFGGLESLFYLKYKLADRADLTLVTDRPYFLFKPNTIYIPFGEPPEKYEIDLAAPLKKQAIDLVQAKVRNLNLEARSVDTEKGALGYDYLVVATGAKM